MPFSGLRPGPGGEQRRGRSPSTSVWNRLDFQRRDQLPDAVPSPVGALNDENQLDFQRAVRGGSRDDEMPFPSSARRSCVLRGGVRADITSSLEKKRPFILLADRCLGEEKDRSRG